MAFKKPEVNVIKPDIKNLSIYLRSTKKFGKSTLFRDVILAKYGDPSRGLLVGCGNEIGYKMLDNLKGFSLAAGFTLNIPIIFAGNALNSLYDNLTEKMQKFSSVVSEFVAGDTLNASLYDPIALDLNNNGKIDTLSLENGVFFDHNGDEIAFKSSWVNSSDGILARDIDGDGKITSGAELFGNFTKLKNGELAKNGTEAGEITLSDGVKISA